VAPLHEKSPNSTSSILRVYAHGIDTGMWTLQPRLSWKKCLGEHTFRVLGALCPLGIPGALNRLRPIWKWVFVENEPFTASCDFACFFINRVYQVREGVLFAGIPADVGVERFISGAIFGGVATDRMDSSENGTVKRV
jgi:hypothetical protein